MDLEGFSLKHLGGKFTDPIKQLIDIDQTKYPETLHMMLIVNAPFIFKAGWTIVSPFLDPITKTRIKVGIILLYCLYLLVCLIYPA